MTLSYRFVTLTLTSSIAIAAMSGMAQDDAAQKGAEQKNAWDRIWANEKVDAGIRGVIRAVDSTRMSKHLFYLAKDPLPYRKLNFTLPGHEKNTLYEADDYLAGRLESWGYRVRREGVRVQAFRRDATKPKQAQYSRPMPEDPWYTAYNLYAEKRGRSRPDEIIVIVAHKDSQSWVDSPGANDNAIGTASVLEMACVLAKHPSERTIRFLFCNEEHTPWTSVTAAQNAKARGDNLVAVFNIDGVGAKTAAEAAAGKKTNVTAYTAPEGKRLAELMSAASARYVTGLAQRIVKRTSPGDDDGSFVRAGYPAAVVNIGSWPYGDPNYHAEKDTPERCDVENAAMAVRATLAAVLTLDQDPAADEEGRIERAIPKQAAARPKQPRKLLVVTLNVRDGKPGKGHPSIAHGNLAIRRMGERTGAYDAVFSNDVSMFRPEKLKQFDAVCFNNTVGVLFDDPELRKSLLDFVAGGKGFVGIHAAAATFVQWPRYDQWPQFGEMLGGYENGGHPWKPNETITLKVEAANHPINAAFGGRGFEISDEVFQFQQPYSRDKLRVLLSIDTTRTDMSPSRRFLPERAADKDFAISWVRRYGEGRVFYSSLGHNPHIFWNPAVLEHFLAGIQFALGDLEADAKPSRQLAGPAARSVGDPLPRATAAAAKPASSGGDWFPLQPVKDDFGPSVLDCSRFVEAPTGRHGFVTVRQDRFVFEDGTPARFWGAQMNMFRKEQLDYTVRRMRRQGINITRMHGMDYSRRGAETSFDYSPESFDRLDYLLAKLGEHGIYMILDIHYPLTYRFKPGDGIPGLPKGGPAPYTQFFNEKAAAVMQRRMADFFTHLNPYTKKRYADDPTLAMVEILNEDSLFWGQVPETFRAELEGKFAAWLKKKYGDLAGLKKAWTAGGKSPLAEGEGLGPAERIRLIANPMFTEKYFLDRPEQRVRGQDQMRFYLELEDKYWADCRAVLRKAGVRVPISATNWQGHGFPTRVHMLGQARLDYIDRHGYWDHPQGEGNLKWNIRTALFHNQPMVKAVNADQDRLVYLGVGNLVIEKAWEQVLGLPMTVSEWNTCVPNQYSLEGPGLMAAYGLLQGWDGPLEFGYFSPDWRNTMGPGSFDLFGNPPQILQFPAIAALWHRQDVREADVVAESLYDPESVFALTEDRKPLPIAAALVGKVGYRFVQGPRKPVVKEIGKNWDPKTLTARSITGELTWNGSDGVVTIDAPRTQAVIGFLGKAEHALGTVRIKSPTDFGAVYVTAMDGDEPVRSARRILITAVGRAKNTGMEYELASKTSRRGGPQWHLKSVGQAPVLLESVAGQIEIRSSHAGQLKAWVLDVVGKRLHEVPLTRKGDRVILDVQPQHKTVYYDLAAE